MSTSSFFYSLMQIIVKSTQTDLIYAVSQVYIHMDDELICNYRKCRKRLDSSFAWVRTLHYVFFLSSINFYVSNSLDS